ncbi:threonine/homoserine/homoserine lactone efflux protein [Anoxybacillus voinovskiensis]|uniref:Threonine/homoserine/homoserine lactone efflux protein n=1 Tax=Anoxybacteroides voinovskiense TaxID=230470 RepID=A0A840DU50_9BACL|nr:MULTISPECIES: LysE family translocator [Anoxybacillus]MBB4073857.1 threonine/homoserine/homoserine lactone efflux protein [Anoxybacillus voinovskiensis]MCL6587341.1 LysE family translocator [Anoxybacillus sp.]GGJ66633.1 lysine transporter LysE [Anoxybacillus voinovskiensis]
MDFVKGILIGLSVAAPVGPIGLLCIQRTMTHGRVIGFISGLGAATADALYGLIAGLGFTAVTHVLLEQQTWIRFIGGLFLAYLGIQTFRLKAARTPAQARGGNAFTAYLSVLFLTLSNPMTILSFLAVFSSLGISPSSVFLFLCGVFFGSALWWLFLSGMVGLFRQRLEERYLTMINRLSGLLLLGFAVSAIYGIF